MYVIGGAGHVDHGKSTLVKALTDTDPDRFPGEKEREVSIVRPDQVCVTLDD